MTCVLRTLCCLLAISALVGATYLDYIHDYNKDGRPVDGPFPNMKNAPYYCYQAPSKGPCEKMMIAYFYDVVRRQCMPMMYSGCGGNENKFFSKATCQINCEGKRRI